MAVTTQMRTQVTQLYVSLFGRAPEADGLGYWVQQLSNGKSLQTVAQDMYNVAPSRIYYPLSLSNEEIVGRFYSNVLGRTADAGGLSYWTGRLNTESTTGTAASRAIAVGTIVTEMITAVTSYSGTDATALASQSLLNNKVAVGMHYAFDMNGNDVAQAAALIPLVTSGANGQVAANTQIDMFFNHAPTITSSGASSIAENAATATVVYAATATDVDANDTKTFSLKASGDAAMLNIDPVTGAVTLKASADFETKTAYNFTVVVTDKFGMTAEKAVIASVINVNEAPVVTSGVIAAAIAENGAAGALVYTATATDVDAGTVLTYSLSGADAAKFTIDSTTGAVYLKAAANFEAKASYSFSVTATDNGSPALATTKAVTLAVTDVNDAPVVTSGATASIAENSAVGTVVYSTTASDIYGGVARVYSLKAGADSAMLNIDPATGTVTLKASADFEAKASYNFTVVVTDADGLTAEKAVVATVLNVNEAPVVTSAAIAAAIAENGAAGAVVYTAAATDVDAGTVLTYSLSGADAAMFTINANTGVVSINAAANFEAKASYAFNVTATDNGSPALATTKAVSLAVNDVNEAPIVISGGTTTIAENAAVGTVLYTAAAADVDAADTQTYSLKAGVGDAAMLSINPTTGAVTLLASADFEAKASYSFTVVVTDAGGLKAEKTVVANVTNVNEAPVIASGNAGTISENAAISTVLYTAIATDVDAGDTQTYSLKAGVGDAAMLTINPTTGAVTLLASADFETKASYSFTVVATDAAGLKAEKAVVATVTNANEAPTVTSADIAVAIAENGAAGAVVYTATASDVDAGTVFAYSLSGPDAAMFTINAATGAVSINAAANFEAKASYAFSVTATDNGTPALAATKAVTLAVTNVNEAPVANVATGSGFENTVLTGSVTGTDVDAGDTLTYALVSGSATNGTVTINGTTGAYTFTPNANYFGPATFQYTVTDRAGLVSTPATVTLSVIDVANVLTAGLDNVTLVNPATETVIGTNNNLNAGDVVIGGANDKVVLGLDAALVGTGAFAGFNLGVGTFQVTNDSGKNAVAFDMSSSNGVNTLVSTNSSSDVRFNFANTVADTDADGFDEVNLNVLNLTAGVNTTLDIRNADAVGNDELNLVVTNSDDNSIAAGAINVTAQGTGGVDQNSAAGIEMVNLSTAGSLSAVRITDLNTPGATVLNVSTAKTLVIGDNNLDLAAIENTLSGSITTVNATGSTGDIALSTFDSTGSATVTGGSGNDTFFTSDVFGDVVVAGAGNDTINAGGGNNNVDGGEGNDTITTTTGNDTIAGGEGNNVIAAGDGTNVITAGNGNNNVTSGTGVDSVTLGNGNNTVVSGAGADTVTVGNGVNAITAGDGNDTVTAGNGGNTIDAGIGNDSVTSGSGADAIDAGTGNDYVSSGAGNDTITTGTGFDTIIAGDGNDRIIGGANFDASGAGTILDPILDSISGGDGTDELQINAGSVDNNFRNVSSVETLTLTTAGTTVLQGGVFVPAVPGPLFTNYAQTAGIQTINALNAGNDVVNAGSFTSNLTVNLANGNDTVATGSGSDTFNVADLTDTDALNAGAGVDVLNLDADTTLTVASQFTGFETINLDTGHNNTIDTANQYNIAVDNDNAPNPNLLNTGVLTVDGSALKAATGDLNLNTLVDANEAAETLVFNGATVSAYNLNVIGGAADDTITGGLLTSTIASGAGDDTINTMGGSNVVTAGTGNDTINFGVATDNVNAGDGNDMLNVGANLTAADTINGGEGTDTITTGTGYADGVYANVTNVEVLTLTSGVSSTLALNAQAAGIRTINGDVTSDNINASAYTTGNLTITGNGGNDTIKSGAGADTITTGNGNDSIESGAGADRVVSGGGTDNIKLGAGNDVASFTGTQLDATDVIDGGADSDTIELNNAAAAVNAAVNLTNVKNIEKFALTSSGDVNPLVADANANSLTFSAGDAGTITTVNVDASALTDADDSFKVTLAVGTSANYQFNITGSSTADTFEKLNVGVNNNVLFNAGAGDDSVIIRGGDLGANISVMGGSGNDSLVQNGGIFIDDDMQNVFSVETLRAAAGTAINAILGAQVDANMGLQNIVGGAMNDNVLLDAAFGTATTALNVNLAAGGNDTINAGATNVAVTFVAGASNITAADVLSGGMTANDVFTLTADNGTADLSNTTNVEAFNVVQSGNNNIGLTLTDNTFTGVAANRITVNAATLDGTNDLDAIVGGLTINAGSVTKALTINSGAGNDNITTGSGDDIVRLGLGNDTFSTGAGNDVVTNLDGNKTGSLGDGNDSGTFGDGNNNLSGDAGNDTITSGNGNNTISGGTGNDSIVAGNGNNMIDGGTDADNITAGNGNNTIAGGTGNDTIVAGTGSNVVDGGDGNDRITINGGALTSSTITGGQGADTITGSAGSDTFRYVQLTDSDGNGITANRDTIVGFDTLKDKVAIEAAMFGNNATLLSFAGNGADFADAQGAVQLGANNGKADFVYQADTGRLWVDLNDDGILNGADLQINFRNADGSIPSSMVFAAGNVTTQDTIAPTAPMLDLLPGSDSNVNTDNVTNMSPVIVRVYLTNTGPGTAAIAGDYVTLKNGLVSLPATQLSAGDITAGFKDVALNLNANAANSLTAVISNNPLAAIQGPASTASAALVVTHDNVVPTAVLVDTTSPALISTDARMVQTYQVTFSEPVTGFDLSDLTITGGGVATGLVAVSPTVYTFSVNVPDNSTTSVGVSVNASAVIDLAGNNSTVSNATTHTVDTVNPTLVITDSVPGTANIATGAITYTFNFSESVSGFDTSDVTVTNGVKGTFTQLTLSSYTLVVTPNAGFEGNMTVSVAAAAANDLNGNTSVAAADNVQAVDTLRPTITIATPIAGDGWINANEDNTVTIAGSATGAVGQSVSVTVSDGVNPSVSGTATVLANGTWSSSTMDVSGLNNGTLTFTAAVADVAGNAASPAGSATATLDNVAPTSTITDDQAGMLFDGNYLVTYTINFNEAVTGFTQSDLVVTGGAIQTFTAMSATQYKVGIWANDNSTANINLSFAAGSAADLAGNLSIANSDTAQTVDRVNPTYVSFVDDQVAYANIADSVVTYTVVFSEPVTNFALGDIVATGGGVASNLVNTVGNTWTFDVTAPASSITPINVSIAAGALTDVIGNLTEVIGTPAVNPQPVDLTRPVVVINDFDGADGFLNSTEDNTFTITGTATDTGSGLVGQSITVTVTDGFTSVNQVVAVTAGAWTANFGDRSATWPNNATLTVTAVVSDVAGNASSAATGTTSTINDKLVTPFTVANVAGDNQLNLAEKNLGVTVTGTVEAGSTVTVDVGGVTRSALVSGTTFSYSLTPTDYFNLGQSAAAFDKTFTINATDVAGNTAQIVKNVTVDTVSPVTPSITNFSTDTGVIGDNITTDTTLVLTGFAEANSTVTLYNDTLALGTVTANGAGAWTFTTDTNILAGNAAFTPGSTNLANGLRLIKDGQYLFNVTSTDAVGNISAPSATQQVLVDTGIVAPTISGFTVNTGATNELGTVVDPIITKDNTLLVTGAAGSAEGGATVYVYSVTAGPVYTLMGQTVADATGAYTFATGLLADGTYQFAASQRDLANNDSVTVLGAAGYSAGKYVTVDTAAPVAPVFNAAAVTLADNGDSATDEITNDSTITLNGTVTLDASSAQTVKVYSDAGLTTLVGTVVVPALSTTWSFAVPALAQGSYTYYATSTDAAANVSASSLALPVVIDLAVPTSTAVVVSDTSNNSTATVFGASDVPNAITSVGNFTITAADLGGSGLSATAAVNVAIAGPTSLAAANYANVAAAQAAIDAFMDARELAFNDGTYTITVIAKDVAGNSGVASTATLKLDTTAPTTPTITLTSDTGTAGDLISKNVSISVTGGTGTDANATQTQYSINGGGTWLDAAQYATATTADASYSVTARVVDAAGNVSATSNTLAVTKDNTAPVVTLALTSDTGTSAVDNITNQGNLNGLSSEAGAVTVSVVAPGTATGFTTTTYANMATALLNFGVYIDAREGGGATQNGVYAATFSVTDGAGNIGTATKTFTLDTVGDTLSVVLANDTSNAAPGTGSNVDGITKDGTVTVNGLTAGATWAYDTDGTSTFGLTGSGNSLSLAANTAYAAGAVQVRSTDAAGNLSAVASNAAGYTTDTVLPATFTMPTATDLAGADSTLSGAEVTAFTLENFTGSVAEAGAAVYYTISDTDPATADITGSMSAAAWNGAGTVLNLSSLTNGNITVTANQVDQAGNVGLTQSTIVSMNKNLVTLTAATYDNALNTLTLVGDFISAGLLNGTVPTTGANSINFSKLSWQHNGVGPALNFASLVTGGTAATLAGGTTLTIQLDANAADAIETNGAFLDGIADQINVGSDFVFGGVTGSTSSFGTGLAGISYKFQGGLAGEDIRGDNGTDTIFGGNGADTIIGGTGNDSLIGGNGSDVLTGGAGNDTFNVDAGSDTITDLATGDIIVVSAGATVIANTTGFVATAATTNAGGANVIANAAGASIDMSLAAGPNGYNLLGGAGNDTLTGSSKADVMTGGAGADVFVFKPGQSTQAALDQITDFQVGVDKVNVNAIDTAVGHSASFHSLGDFASLALAIAAAQGAGQMWGGSDNWPTVAGDGVNTYVFLDDNHNHIYDATDSIIMLVGVSVATVTAGDFIL